MTLLTLDRVSKTYSNAKAPVRALREVTLDVDAGTFLAIRGASGCGKSTLLLTAGTLLAPDAGEVTIDGQSPYRMSSDARAMFRGRTLGFVFQQFHLVPYLNVLENVMAPALALMGTGSGIGEEVTRLRADELLERFGLSGRWNHTPAQLSSGERQRCALARALLNRPRLLLADEPTGNLDGENAAIVLTAMREFVREGGAVLLVTHDDRAAAEADQTLWMTQGCVCETEPSQSDQVASIDPSVAALDRAD